MTYPVDPNTGKQRKPGPHLAIGIIVILLGTAMGITGLAVGVTKVVHDFSGTVYTAPGSVHSHLTPGTYELFQAVDGSNSSRPVQGSGITGVRVTDSGGTTVGIFRPGSRETISRGSTPYLGLVEFKISHTDDYTIQVVGSQGEQFFISRSFGDLAKHAAGWFVLMGAGILVGIIGVILLIVGIVRRSRARRAAYGGGYPGTGYPAGGYPPAGYPAQQPTAPQPAAQPAAGWYPDTNVPGTMRWWDGTRWTDQTQPQSPE